jgi:positive regulator of sigma E activity
MKNIIFKNKIFFYLFSFLVTFFIAFIILFFPLDKSDFLSNLFMSIGAGIGVMIANKYTLKKANPNLYEKIFNKNK